MGAQIGESLGERLGERGADPGPAAREVGQIGNGAGEGHAAGLQVDKEEDVVCNETTPGQDLSGEEVCSGKDGHVLQDMVGAVPGETLGFDAVAVGDVDGDGLSDYLITSAWSGVNGLRSGRVYIVAGQKTALNFPPGTQ